MGGGDLGLDLDLDPDPVKILWIRIWQNYADPLDPDLKHAVQCTVHCTVIIKFSDSCNYIKI